MSATRGFALAIAMVGAFAHADAATVRLLDPALGGTPRVSPQVAYNPHTDDFVVVATAGYELRSSRSGLKGNGLGPWVRSSERLAQDWGDRAHLSYNRWSRSYLVAGLVPELLRLNQKGRVQRRHVLEGLFYPEVLTATRLAGTPNWFLFVQQCKYGCWIYGVIVDARGKVLAEVDLDFPLEDLYQDYRRQWGVGYDRDTETLLMVWEDGYDANYDGPSRAILGQRFKADGTLSGDRLEIARNRRDASQPHLVYNSQAREWLIVYRQGTGVKGRFLRADRLSKPFRPGPRWRPGVTPSVAYSPRRDSYLVTWVQWGDGAGIYGRWVRAGGRLVGDWFTVNDPAADQFVSAPGNSACSESGTCLVTWINDGEDGTVRGQYLRVP